MDWRLSDQQQGGFISKLVFAVLLLLTAAPIHGVEPMQMRLTLADKFSIQIPEFMTVVRSRESISPQQNYALSTIVSADIVAFIAPYESSSARVPGKCIISNAFDRGDPTGPVFWAGEVLSNNVTTKLGAAKWTHAVHPNLRSSRPLFPSEAYLHIYIAVVPLKSERIVIGLYSVSPGWIDRFETIEGRAPWPTLKDKILPSIAQTSCR